MKNLSEIIKKRATPGVLIFDLHERLLFSNPEALDMMPILGEMVLIEGTVSQVVPDEVLRLLRKLKTISTEDDHFDSNEQNCVVQNVDGTPCALRAFHIGHDVEKKNPTHIMVMVERIAETHEPDFSKAKLEFDLSKREIEVLRFVCNGLGNKAISDNLFISEHTVKDHIKNIMRKMDASTRSEMIARLK